MVSKMRKWKFSISTEINLCLALSSFRMLEFSSIFKDLSKADLIISSTIPASSSPFLLFLSSEPSPGSVTNSILFLVAIFVKKTHWFAWRANQWALFRDDIAFASSNSFPLGLKHLKDSWNRRGVLQRPSTLPRHCPELMKNNYLFASVKSKHIIDWVSGQTWTPAVFDEE